MDNIRIIIANEPRAYREAIAAVFAQLRPHAEVLLVEPDELDGCLARLAPQLVLYSRASAAVEGGAAGWVLLHPDGAARVEVAVAGRRESLGGIELDGLLALVDRAAA